MIYTTISVNSQQTNTTMAACTYVKKSDGGCITTAKQTHHLHDDRVNDFLSKWTDMACASLVTSDDFAGFYYISTTKKLCYLLLPVIEKVASGKDIVVGTASNSASLSKFLSITTLTVGSLFTMIPAEMPTGLFPEGPNFSKTDNPKLKHCFPSPTATRQSKETSLIIASGTLSGSSPK